MYSGTIAAGLIIAAAAVGALTAVVRFERLCLAELDDTADVELLIFTRQGWTALILPAIPLGGSCSSTPDGFADPFVANDVPLHDSRRMLDERPVSTKPNERASSM